MSETASCGCMLQANRVFGQYACSSSKVLWDLFGASLWCCPCFWLCVCVAGGCVLLCSWCTWGCTHGWCAGLSCCCRVVGWPAGGFAVLPCVGLGKGPLDWPPCLSPTYLCVQPCCCGSQDGPLRVPVLPLMTRRHANQQCVCPQSVSPPCLRLCERSRHWY